MEVREAIEILTYLRFDDDDIGIAIETAISALEKQEWKKPRTERVDHDKYGDELISRQAAIDALKEVSEHYTDKGREWHPHINFMVQAIEELPSADVPDRKVGKWIVVKRHEHYPSGKPYEQVQCPFCKRFDNNWDGNFCGYCGADMKGENDG